VTYHREALSLHPSGHPDRPVSLYNSASTALACYKRLGQGCPGDLNQAITYYREALSLYAPGHPDCSAPLNNLANALFTRYQLQYLVR
jgi:hypothetical protein